MLAGAQEVLSLVDQRLLPVLIGLTPHREQLVIDIGRADLIDAERAETVSSTPAQDMPRHIGHSFVLIETNGPVIVHHCEYSMVTIAGYVKLLLRN